MAIYLNKEETDYLNRVLTNQTKWWIRDSILDKLSTDIARKSAQQKCSHEFHRYSGEKHCCSKCETYEEGMGYWWKMEELVDPVDFKIIRQQIKKAASLFDEKLSPSSIKDGQTPIR